MRFLRNFLLLVISCCALQVSAHEVRPAKLDINQISDSTFQVSWKLPAIKEGVLRLKPVFEINHDVLSNLPSRDLGDAYITEWIIQPREKIEGSQVIIDGLEKTITDVFVTINLLNGETESFLVRPNNPSFEFLLNRSDWQIIKDYIIIGVEHIWLGYDHLLFVLCLLCLIKGIKKLIKTITAFTVAHSITLASSVLGFVTLPSAPVEAVIALSIIFLAVEIFQQQKGNKVFTAEYPWIVAMAFGLLHGFGFAGALTDVGLPQSAIPISLLGFNLGVEIGQVIFILAIIGLLKLFDKIIQRIPEIVPQIFTYSIGGLASFWLIERVVGFW